MGIFGWDLPPGCSMSDIDPPSCPCPVCGRDSDGGCICPECPKCGDYGNVRCYEQHGLVRTPEQIASRATLDEQMAADARVEPDYSDVPEPLE
jgi:hypothetical protein